MTTLAYVAIGGALGAACRYGVGRLALSLALSAPWATLFVNVAGSFLFGALAALPAGTDADSPWRSTLVVGFLGAFTTFSTFSGEAVHLWRNARFQDVAAHFLSHNLLSFAACLAGFLLIEAARR